MVDMDTTSPDFLLLDAQPMPFVVDDDGVARVGNTRVTLDSIVAAFLEGAMAEEIAMQYPTVALSDVYAVISYYLRYRSEIDAYLEQRQQQAKAIRERNEAQYDPAGIRQRLLTRKASAE
jgi:uncharacterized protein (DUF433 family)